MTDLGEWDAARFAMQQVAAMAGTQPSIPVLEDSQFSITKINYTPPHPIVHMVTSNNVLVMALENSRIIRLDLTDPEMLEGTIV